MIKFKLSGGKWTRWIVLLMRLVVGCVFIFSGFVKAIDPWGVLYKFQDYVSALGCDWLEPFLLFGAFTLSVVEFVVGVCLIIGAYRRVAVWIAFMMMLVMTPLTAWLAMTGAVVDCGCFGEVLVLSNEMSLVKNVILLLFTWYLLKYNVRLWNFYSPSIQWIVTSVTVAYVFVIACYGYFYQPMLDFRQYKAGVNLAGGEDADGEDAFVFVYEKDGQKQEFDMENVPADDTTWHFVERKVVNREVIAKLNGEETLAIFDGDEEVTRLVFSSKSDNLLLVFSDLEDIDIAYTYLINLLDDCAHKQDIEVCGLSDAGREDVEKWNDISMATYPMYSATDAQLKMLVRGNPSVVYVKDGVVMWKRVLQSINAARVEQAVNEGRDFMWIAEDYNGEDKLNKMSLAYVSLMVLILVLNRSYRVFKFGQRLIEKRRRTVKKTSVDVQTNAVQEIAPDNVADK